MSCENDPFLLTCGLYSLFSTEVNERYCNPHLNSGNIQFLLHLTSPLVVNILRDLDYYSLSLRLTLPPFHLLPAKLEAILLQEFALINRDNKLWETIRQDSSEVELSPRKYILFKYLLATISGWKVRYGGGSVSRCHQTGEFDLFPFILTVSLRNRKGKDCERKLYYIIIMSKIIRIGEMLYHQLLRQSMFPLIYN